MPDTTEDARARSMSSGRKRAAGMCARVDSGAASSSSSPGSVQKATVMPGVGARELAEGLGRALLSWGGLAWTAARPRRILLKGGRAVGIELEDGRSVAARRCLISGIDPGQTLSPIHI